MSLRAKSKSPISDRKGLKGVVTRMNVDGWRSLRLMSLEKNISLNDLGIEAFNDLLKKHGKKPVVEGRSYFSK